MVGGTRASNSELLLDGIPSRAVSPPALPPRGEGAALEVRAVGGEAGALRDDRLTSAARPSPAARPPAVPVVAARVRDQLVGNVVSRKGADIRAAVSARAARADRDARHAKHDLEASVTASEVSPGCSREAAERRWVAGTGASA